MSKQNEEIFYETPSLSNILEDKKNINKMKNLLQPNNTKNDRDENFIFKTEEIGKNIFSIIRYKKTFIGYIDLDLFLQRIAFCHQIFEKNEDNVNLLDGFCIQHSNFISSINLIKKIISCFNYFYYRFTNNKNENQIDENVSIDLEQLNKFQKRKSSIKKKKSSIQLIKIDNVTDIPYGLIQFVLKYIDLHKIYPLHQINEKVANEINQFFNNILKISEIKSKYENDIINTYQKVLLEISTKSNQKKQENNKQNFNKIFPNFKENSSFFDILLYDSKDIANELTRVTFFLFSQIEPKEFFKGCFTKKDKEKTSPNIVKVVKRFNDLSFWVIEEILSYDYSTQRAKIIEKFIEIAFELLYLNNFNDCMSIISGLGQIIIMKLVKTWKSVSTKSNAVLKKIQRVMNFEDNYKNIREQISFCEKNQKPFLPFLGYYTKRICFIEEAGPYVKDNKDNLNLINVDKILQFFLVLKDFNKFKNNKYKFKDLDENVKNEFIIFQCIETLKEDDLDALAGFIEPNFVLSSKKLKVKRVTTTEKKFKENYNKSYII